MEKSEYEKRIQELEAKIKELEEHDYESSVRNGKLLIENSALKSKIDSLVNVIAIIGADK